MEAPPAVMSTYLGESMTAYLMDFMNGHDAAYNPTKKPVDFGVRSYPYIVSAMRASNM